MFCQMTSLLESSFDLLKGRQCLHYAALNAINKILDLCFAFNAYEHFDARFREGAAEVGLEEGCTEPMAASAAPGPSRSFLHLLAKSPQPQHAAPAKPEGHSTFHVARASVASVFAGLRRLEAKEAEAAAGAGAQGRAAGGAAAGGGAGLGSGATGCGGPASGSGGGSGSGAGPNATVCPGHGEADELID